MPYLELAPLPRWAYSQRNCILNEKDSEKNNGWRVEFSTEEQCCVRKVGHLVKGSERGHLLYSAQLETYFNTHTHTANEILPPFYTLLKHRRIRYRWVNINQQIPALYCTKKTKKLKPCWSHGAVGNTSDGLSSGAYVGAAGFNLACNMLLYHLIQFNTMRCFKFKNVHAFVLKMAQIF